ncbi:DNA-formamidopyrimidine glycosylase [Leptothoe sp. PORK10 BA2]|uniref:DNA-formamidopyrimidine glycosylase n=1 Tax=Leptothoe sp. PORK10 BA2 TaxID=3110254 RepID=UPI002B1FC6AE|nr:DNA-formamidopyrimidine glycosylase [Leptothoe sp. PORK10 BA2]MEA5463448.1 DNA-formamidopyrimidine glycosylase [Leptothoe sp. PORK10 BA2]
MPELPEVETVRRGLSRVTLHHPIRGGDVLLDRSIAHPIFVEEFLPAIIGAEILAWQRRGKYLLAALGRQNQPVGWLGCHLRMTGQLLWVPQSMPVSSHCRVRIFFDHDRELRYVDQRTFGRLWWVPPGVPPEQIMTGLQRLGPEPFADDFSLDYMQLWFKRQRPVKNALLDQAMVAGIGNIYADEALFLSGIRPRVKCDRISRPRLKRLHTAIRKVLTDSIEAGGTTFSDFRDIHGTNGNYGGVAWVYDRENEPCRVCSTPIQRIKLAGRSAHYCPSCQK